MPFYVLKFSILHKWANLLIAKLAKSIQVANKKNNDPACYILPSIFNNNGGSDMICPEISNSDGGSNYTSRLQNSDLATEQQDS